MQRAGHHVSEGYTPGGDSGGANAVQRAGNHSLGRYCALSYSSSSSSFPSSPLSSSLAPAFLQSFLHSAQISRHPALSCLPCLHHHGYSTNPAIRATPTTPHAPLNKHCSQQRAQSHQHYNQRPPWRPRRSRPIRPPTMLRSCCQSSPMKIPTSASWLSAICTTYS